MSHFKERKEKNCLNCNAEVIGRFCHVCGQENIEPKESVWHLITHFFYDITHFDGKFFNTVKYLLLRPGFLTAEYVRGKRMTYLHPIRMYVFTSAFFFLIFFSFISPHSEPEKEGIEGLKEALILKQNELKNLKEMQEGTKDSLIRAAVTKAMHKYDIEIATLTDSISKMESSEGAKDKQAEDLPVFIRKKIPEIKGTIDSVTREVQKEIDKEKNGTIDSPEHNTDTGYRYKQPVSLKKDTISAKNTIGKKDTAAKSDTPTVKRNRNVSTDVLDFEFYKDEATYLAVQKELPPEKQDGSIKRSLILKLLHWHEQQSKDGGKAFETLKEKFKHSFPTLLFVSLPIFAFLLKLLYVRRTKFYYADHGIFAIHTYCATFILLLLYYMFDAIGDNAGWWIFYLIKAALVIYIMYYTYKAMRNFYEQGRFKTFIKYLFLGFMTSIVMTFLILVFFVISAYNV
ncbi:MAG: hypothetical protein BGP13_20590 [Sphingobacteriales bacterium 40-81]|nr:MAG: hypothetical protein BGP13_20590 [Sphingobacteriales bacterium 40-81]